jgi:hypothetical protein
VARDPGFVAKFEERLKDLIAEGFEIRKLTGSVAGRSNARSFTAFRVFKLHPVPRVETGQTGWRWSAISFYDALPASVIMRSLNADAGR